MMRITFSNCRLYSWMRLICTSNMESGSTEHAGLFLDDACQPQLVLALDFLEGCAKFRVLGERLQIAQLVAGR